MSWKLSTLTVLVFPAIAALICFSMTLASSAKEWPTWRGPSGDGVSEDNSELAVWGPEKNVRWKVALASGSNSSPILRGQKVFVTAANSDGTRRSLFAFDRHNGSTLWQQTVVFDGRESRHSSNPFCLASPVTDDEVVCASFGSAVWSAAR